uniref:Uncharacterized protein n=1 Tax=Helianthus annuus TaxID=4232 RepID=A0A251UH28_HELAN
MIEFYHWSSSLHQHNSIPYNTKRFKFQETRVTGIQILGYDSKPNLLGGSSLHMFDAYSCF